MQFTHLADSTVARNDALDFVKRHRSAWVVFLLAIAARQATLAVSEEQGSRGHLTNERTFSD